MEVQSIVLCSVSLNVFSYCRQRFHCSTPMRPHPHPPLFKKQQHQQQILSSLLTTIWRELMLWVQRSLPCEILQYKRIHERHKSRIKKTTSIVGITSKQLLVSLRKQNSSREIYSPMRPKHKDMIEHERCKLSSSGV